MKRNKLLLILAIVVVLTLVLAGCKGDCSHEEYGAWQIVKAPTQTAEGEAIRICASCGVAETATLAKLSDSSVWTASSATATHTSAGKIVYTSATYGSVEVFVDRLTDHVYDKEVAAEQYLVSAADCTHAAIYRKSCSCGAVSTATFTSGTASGHKATAHPAVSPVHTATTLTNGNTAYWSCDTCGKVFSDAACATETTLAAVTVVAAHNYGGLTIVTEADCTTAGASTHECATCGKVENVVIAALGHDYTSGIVVPVKDSSSSGWGDGEYYEPDEEGDVVGASHHARVCDVCHKVETDNLQNHIYGEERFVINANKTISALVDCSVCGHVGEGSSNIPGIISEYEVVKHVDATYTKAGYTSYKKIDSSRTIEFTVIEPQLVAPYIGLTYNVMQLYHSADKTSGMSAMSDGSPVNLLLDSQGKGIGSSYPFNGNIAANLNLDGNISLTVNDGTPYSGKIDDLTGIMIVSDDKFDTVMFVTPFNVTRNLFSVSFCPDGMFINYHIDCGIYTGHDISILVCEDEVFFGVSFVNSNGDVVVAEDCYKLNELIVLDSNGDELTQFISDGKDLRHVDGYQGEYTGTKGKLTVDGMGHFTLAVSQGINVSGVYELADDPSYTADAYVLNEKGQKTEYYKATIEDTTYTFEEQKNATERDPLKTR
ncbi:MAG: hypothetical protein NC132_07020, partial [Corallococcus sp.]|nr:hypothetical protein [Corallococcus sp.]